MAGLNIPKREQLENGPKFSDLNKARLKAQDRLSDYAERAAVKGADVAFGDDTGDSLLEDLAYGAVPGGSLFQRAKTGTRPGLLDFADFIPGSGALKAMLPIAVKPTLDVMKAGKRMGKTSRNLAKAKNPYIERWHRTKASNDQSIRDKGLLIGKDNPNYGKNTGDADDLSMPVNWLANNPTNIPVLQYPFMTDPSSTVTYRVKIPKDIYYDTPRLKFRSGRRGSGTHDTYVVGKKESSLTGERGRQTGEDAMIDLFGASIPPEWLEKMPNDEIQKQVAHHKQMLDFEANHGDEIVGRTKSQVGNDIVKDEMNSWMPASDRLSTYKFDFGGPKSVYPTPAREQFFNVARDYEGVPKYGALTLFGDLPEKFDSKVKYWFPSTMPKEMDKYAEGSISRGWAPDKMMFSNVPNPYYEHYKYATHSDFDPKDRIFDWDKYNRLVYMDEQSPQEAAYFAQPRKKLIDSPTFGLTTLETESKPTSAGAMSRPYYEKVGPSQTWWDNKSFAGSLETGDSPYTAARIAQNRPLRKRVNPETGLLEQVTAEGWTGRKVPNKGAISRAHYGPEFGDTKGLYDAAKNDAMASFRNKDPDSYYKYNTLSPERQAEINAEVDELRKQYFRKMIREQWDPDAL